MILVKIFLILVVIYLIYKISSLDFFNNPYKENDWHKMSLVILVCIFISTLRMKPILTEDYLNEDYDIYNKYLVDAIIEGKLSIDLEPSEELKKLENPYDVDARKDIEYSFDTAYYNGKYYVYFGVVPALILFVPFKIFTGLYFDTVVATMIFAVLSIIVNVLLTMEIYKRWFKDIPFKLLILFIVSNLISGLYVWNTWRMWLYELTLMSGFLFVQLGILLMLKAIKNEKIRYKYIFFSCLSMALAVGCRPTLVISSAVLLPFMYNIIKNADQSKKIKVWGVIVIPYLVVAIPMMIYNYARFGNILEFGAKYQLTVVDVTDLSERYKDIPKGMYKYFLEPPKLKSEFPYMSVDYSLDGFTENYCNCGMVCGILFFNLSLISCFWLFKYYKKTKDKILKGLMIILPIAGIILGVVNVVMGASVQRYVVDFFWMFSMLAMIIWSLIYQNCKNEREKKIIFTIIFVLMIISVVINFFGTYFNSEYNYLEKFAPELYNRLLRWFSF